MILQTIVFKQCYSEIQTADTDMRTFLSFMKALSEGLSGRVSLKCFEKTSK